MTTRVTKLVSRVEPEEEFIDFAMTDKYGRRIGVVICRRVEVYEEMTEEEEAQYLADRKAMSSYTTIENLRDNSWWAGTHFVWRGQATRNGREYGASQCDHREPSAEVRELQIADYIRDAKKRQQKNSVVK